MMYNTYVRKRLEKNKKLISFCIFVFLYIYHLRKIANIYSYLHTHIGIPHLQHESLNLNHLPNNSGAVRSN